MTANGVSGTPNTYDPVGHGDTPHTIRSAPSKVVRGAKAVAEMMNRPGMIERADIFFCKEPGDSAPYKPYFLEKIRQNKLSLPPSPSEKECEILSHKIYAIYRRETIERACQEVNINPTAWTFKNREEWDSLRETFQDFMWTYSKMVYSGAPGSAIAEVLKQEFPSLPKDFWPSVNAVILPAEQEDFYPNS